MHDPDRVFLRRGLRVAVVSPALFAIVGFALDLRTAGMFVSFGSFASLGLADLGGPLPRRFLGYLVMTAVGASLVVVATLVAEWIVLACVATAVVGFLIRFVGVLGGYSKASGFAVTLAFVLAVALPTTNSPLGRARRRLGRWRNRRCLRRGTAVAGPRATQDQGCHGGGV